MNSRKRIKLAVNHKEPDRIPIDFGAMRSTGISIVAYSKLRNELGVKSGLPKMYDFIQQLAYPEKEVRDLFHIDAIDAGQAFLEELNQWREWKLNDGTKCLIPNYLNIEIDDESNVYVKDNNNLILGKKPKSSLYVDQTYWVYGDLPRIPENFSNDDLTKFIWSIPSPPWHLNIFNDKQYGLFIKTIKNLHDTTDYTIMLAVGCNLFETGTWLRKMDNFLCDIYIDKNRVKKLISRLVENNLIFLDRVLKGVGNYVDLLQFGDDLGSQNMPFMSPDVFVDVFVPGYKKMWDFIHENYNCKVFLHSCGSIYELLGSLIDAGIDILNPVQTTAANMEPEKLKKEFGRYITFWGGGCNTRDILPFKAPKEIKEDVKRRIEAFKSGGGFVFSQIHNIQADVPIENIVAMFDAAYEYGRYR